MFSAGGAHDVTRGSMHDSLSGDTYTGRYIAANISTGLPHNPEESMIFASTRREGKDRRSQNQWPPAVSIQSDTRCTTISSIPR
jgi:hypothetical protein